VNEVTIVMEAKVVSSQDGIHPNCHIGALDIPSQVMAIMKTVKSKIEPAINELKLPPKHSIVRPTLDKDPLTVTYLREEKRITITEGGSAPTISSKTIAENKPWLMTTSLLSPDRLRGGGNPENNTCSEDSKGSILPEIYFNSEETKTSTEVANNSMELKVNGDSTEEIVEKRSEIPRNVFEPAPVEESTSSEGQTVHIALVTESFSKPAPLAAANVVSMESNSISQKKYEIEIKQSPLICPNDSSGSIIEKSAIKKQEVKDEDTISSKPPENEENAPQTVTSSEQLNLSQAKIAVTNIQPSNVVLGLSKIPPPQYTPNIPGPSDEMQAEIKNSRPSWYKNDCVSDIERSLLPEWFDSSAQHRTHDSYIKTREHVLEISKKLGNRFITSTLIRRTVPGDIGSLNRLFHFLTSFSLINADAINDSMPTALTLRDSRKRTLATTFESKLLEAVMKRHKGNPSSIDWDSVAEEIGETVSPDTCRKHFLSLDFNLIRCVSASSDSTKLSSETTAKGCGFSLDDILTNVDDSVLKPTIDTALEQTRDLVKAQKACIASSVISQAVIQAVSQEDALVRTLAELTEKRMERLEKRIELLNDLEGMMEAERMALELERRDLYTRRCRLWLGENT
jgi:SWI/SNF related-matrix-associated actin-dependent regulator of chromatin subfamily C